MAVKEASAGAASRMRSALAEAGAGTCCRCASTRPLDDLLIVYATALACGGTDTASNVRLMCKGCAASRR
jgi:hypothetical protein